MTERAGRSRRGRTVPRRSGCSLLRCCGALGGATDRARLQRRGRQTAATIHFTIVHRADGPDAARSVTSPRALRPKATACWPRSIARRPPTGTRPRDRASAMAARGAGGPPPPATTAIPSAMEEASPSYAASGSIDRPAMSTAARAAARRGTAASVSGGGAAGQASAWACGAARTPSGTRQVVALLEAIARGPITAAAKALGMALPARVDAGRHHEPRVWDAGGGSGRGRLVNQRAALTGSGRTFVGRSLSPHRTTRVAGATDRWGAVEAHLPSA